MNQTELKNKIASAYDDATPNVLDEVKRACGEVEQEERVNILPISEGKHRAVAPRLVVAVASLLLVFLVGMSVGNRKVVPAPQTAINNTEKTSEMVQPDRNTEVATSENKERVEVATIYIDVNPSIEVKIDSDMRVMNCVAANADAELILKGMNLEGVEVNTALTAIVGSMYINGYLQGDTDAILVSVDTEVDGILDEISVDVNQLFTDTSLDCAVEVQIVNGEEVAELATQNSISVGKMEFIERIVEGSFEFSEEDFSKLSEYSIRNLYDIFKGIDGHVPMNPDSTEKTNPSEEAQNSTEHIGGSVPSENPISDATNEFVNQIVNKTTDYVKDTTNYVKDTTTSVVDYFNSITGTFTGKP